MTQLAATGFHTLKDNLDPATVAEPVLIRLCLFLATSAVIPLDGLGFVAAPLDVGAPFAFGTGAVGLRILTADSLRTKMPNPGAH